jgi:hypothetical protein
MTHVTLRAEFEKLIDPYAPVGQVATGFQFTEGPIAGMRGVESSRRAVRRTSATA